MTDSKPQFPRAAALAVAEELLARRNAEIKECAKCHEKKPITEFTLDRRLKIGHTSRCKECIKEYRSKMWLQDHRGKCSVPNCVEPSHAHGFCTKHYQRWERHGDPQLMQPAGAGSWDPSDFDCAYLAGFFDGEGTIGLRRYVTKANSWGHTYSPYVQVGNTDSRIIQWLPSIFGGQMRNRIQPAKGNNKLDFYVWAAGANTAIEFCKFLLPFLRMKRDQAQNLIDEFKNHGALGGRQRRAVEDWQRLEMLYHKMKALNKRGRV